MWLQINAWRYSLPLVLLSRLARAIEFWQTIDDEQDAKCMTKKTCSNTLVQCNLFSNLWSYWLSHMCSANVASLWQAPKRKTGYIDNMKRCTVLHAAAWRSLDSTGIASHHSQERALPIWSCHSSGRAKCLHTENLNYGLLYSESRHLWMHACWFDAASQATIIRYTCQQFCCSEAHEQMKDGKDHDRRQ